MRKVTMRDVAKAAGVSVATVSYVLNNSEKETISGDTKHRVMKAVEELNYIPDLAARALTRKKSGLLGIFIMNRPEGFIPWRKSFYTEFVSMLIMALFEMGYHAIVEHIDPSKDKLDIIYERALDGVFLLNFSEEDIYKTTRLFKVPIVLIDTYAEDTIFHKVLSDYAGAIEEAKKLLVEDNPIIVADSPSTRRLIERFLRGENLKGLHSAESKDDFRRLTEFNMDRKFIIFNELLALLSKDCLPPGNVAVICSEGNEYLLDSYRYKLSFSNKKKAALASDIMIDYLNKNYHSEKLTLIKAEEA